MVQYGVEGPTDQIVVRVAGKARRRRVGKGHHSGTVNADDPLRRGV